MMAAALKWAALRSELPSEQSNHRQLACRFIQSRSMCVCWRTGLVFALLLQFFNQKLLQAKTPAQKPDIQNTTEVTPLNGPSWKLGSFAMDEGESRGAFKPGFDDSGFRVVQVPGEVQLQTGLKGKDLFLQSKSLNMIN